MQIRPETPSDATAIDRVIESAFADKSHTGHTEAAIVRALRADNDLTLSLVAERAGSIAGHIAFSPVRFDGVQERWYGLGPLAVQPDFQRQGVGSALVHRGLEDLRLQAARGCVVLGDPGFYGRFGFASDGSVTYGEIPARFVQWITFNGPAPSGEVRYASAFDMAS